MTLRVAIVGDSAMWGQGIALEHTFARLAATRLAQLANQPLEILPGLGAEPGRGHPRSGAKIGAAVDDPGRKVDVVLPSGAATQAAAGDRVDFCEMFGSEFANDTEMRRFLDGVDDRPAAGLFGENPATFPTVTAQVQQLVGPDLGPTVDVLLIDGGINDIDFEEVLDPFGPGQAEIDRSLELVFGEQLRTLLQLARRTCPKAVVLVTGYFSVLSKRSDHEELVDMAEYLSGRAAWALGFNGFLNLIGFGVDVDRAVDKATRRSEIAAAHAHFWMRRTVAELRSDSGPPILYVHPAFRPEHALFAGPGVLVHEGYRPPHGGRNPVSDEMLDERLARIPRLDLLNDYHRIRNRIPRPDNNPADQPQRGFGPLGSLVRDLLERDDLPAPLTRAAQRIIDLESERSPRPSGDDVDTAMAELREALDDEIGRIDIATIASFIHPNPAGAARYADRIVGVYEQYRRFSVRAAVASLGPRAGATLALGQSLRRHGVDARRGLRQLAPIASVESVACQFTGLDVGAAGPGPFGEPLLPPVAVRVALGRKATFELPWSPLISGDVFRAFDVAVDVGIGDITEVTVQAPDVTFDELTVYLNSREFFRATPAEGDRGADRIRFSISR